MEESMRKLLSFTSVAVVMLGGLTAEASDLPTFEKLGFPISLTQVSVLGSADVQESSPILTLTLAGMPASPHQVAVLTPRQRVIDQQIANSGGRATTGLVRLSPVVAIQPAR
jgi:hypothetical protein